MPASTLDEMRASDAAFDLVPYAEARAAAASRCATTTAAVAWCSATRSTSTRRTGSKSASRRPSATASRTAPDVAAYLAQQESGCGRWTAFR